MNFKMWLENTSPGVVTFDFDSTMTTPWWCPDEERWREGDPMNPDHSHSDNIALMRKFAAEGYTIHIVTARSPMEVPQVREFIHEHKLPVTDIFPTNGEPKGPILAQLGSLIHHDDLPQSVEDPQHVFQGQWVKIFHPADGY